MEVGVMPRDGLLFGRVTVKLLGPTRAGICIGGFLSASLPLSFSRANDATVLKPTLYRSGDLVIPTGSDFDTSRNWSVLRTRGRYASRIYLRARGYTGVEGLRMLGVGHA